MKQDVLDLVLIRQRTQPALTPALDLPAVDIVIAWHDEESLLRVELHRRCELLKERERDLVLL